MNAMSPQPSNPGMDADVFEQFYEQLTRYVRERLIPAEPEVIANDKDPSIEVFATYATRAGHLQQRHTGRLGRQQRSRVDSQRRSRRHLQSPRGSGRHRKRASSARSRG